MMAKDSRLKRFKADLIFIKIDPCDGLHFGVDEKAQKMPAHE